jgi:hypothetical protein
MTQLTPVDADQNATLAQLLRRAQQDYTATQAAAHAKEAQGSTGERDGILPGGGTQ